MASKIRWRGSPADGVFGPQGGAGRRVAAATFDTEAAAKRLAQRGPTGQLRASIGSDVKYDARETRGRVKADKRIAPHAFVNNQGRGPIKATGKPFKFPGYKRIGNVTSLNGKGVTTSYVREAKGSQFLNRALKAGAVPFGFKYRLNLPPVDGETN